MRLTLETSESVFKGSFETLRGDLETAIGESIEGAELVATHDGVAFAFKDDKFLKVEWSVGADGIEITSVDDSGLGVLGESTEGGYVAKCLSESVKGILAGEDVCNRLHEAAMNIRQGGVYFASDARDYLLENLSDDDTEWCSYYGENKEMVRKSMHGSLGEIESYVPRTRYGRMSTQRLEQFRPELSESFKVLVELTNEIVATTESLDSPNAVSLHSDFAEVAKRANQMSSLLRESQLPMMAVVHDLLAERLKEALVMSAFEEAGAST